MTIDEFLEKLPKDGWSLMRGGEIRRIWRNVSQCPVCAAANVKGIAAWTVGARLGLSGKRLEAIIIASDGQSSRLRQRILAACGLQEQV